MLPLLYIVVPCYNEADVLPVTAPLFLAEINELTGKSLISEESRILFVDDGSRDKTAGIIKGLAEADPHYSGISLSRNCGHQNALLAGLMFSKTRADITISIDCDGQDDISAMEEMVKKFNEGADVVYGVRSDRKSDSFLKRATAEGFYKVMNRLGAETVFNHADYRLLSKRALSALSEFSEVNVFLRGMVPLVGFKSSSVYYERRERLAGKSHYPFKKMLSFAVDGITSFSTKPLRFVVLLGMIFTFLSIVGIIWSVVAYFTGNSVSGWSSTVAFICFFGGIQIFCLGIIGEYIGKIYSEVKHRPRYIISEEYGCTEPRSE